VNGQQGRSIPGQKICFMENMKNTVEKLVLGSDKQKITESSARVTFRDLIYLERCFCHRIMHVISLITDDARCTREIKSTIAIAKATFNT
jgi:hypothetical protein